MNYYEILGVDKNASQDDIKRAYRKMASLHHPDKGGDKSKFQEVQQAYSILSDEQKRAEYDQPRPFAYQSRGAQFQNQPFDFDTIFNMFGAQFNRAQNKPQARLTLWIGLQDVATRGTRIVAIGTPTGTQEVSIEIPTGITDGDNVRYPGIGPGGADLIIQFRIRPDAAWQRQGNNIVTETVQSIWALINGGTFSIQDIQGNNLELTIPPRTQPGTLLRARNRGLPDQNGNFGDMLVRVNARIPSKISPELLSAIAKEATQ